MARSVFTCTPGTACGPASGSLGSVGLRAAADGSIRGPEDSRSQLARCASQRVVLPCSGPIAVGVFALSFSVGEFLGKTALFLVFGLGFGSPLLALSFISDAKGGWLTRLVADRHDLINRIAGAILVLVGLYDFYINLPALRIYWPA